MHELPGEYPIIKGDIQIKQPGVMAIPAENTLNGGTGQMRAEGYPLRWENNKAFHDSCSFNCLTQEYNIFWAIDETAALQIRGYFRKC
jgi:hypothetical protein